MVTKQTGAAGRPSGPRP